MIDIIHDLKVAWWALRNDFGWKQIRIRVVWPIRIWPGYPNTPFIGAIIFQRARLHILVPYEVEFSYFMASADIK